MLALVDEVLQSSGLALGEQASRPTSNLATAQRTMSLIGNSRNSRRNLADCDRLSVWVRRYLIANRPKEKVGLPITVNDLP